MQKALIEMNIQLSNVLSDISGISGMTIIEAILDGERDPWTLAAMFVLRQEVEFVPDVSEKDPGLRPGIA